MQPNEIQRDSLSELTLNDPGNMLVEIDGVQGVDLKSKNISISNENAPSSIVDVKEGYDDTLLTVLAYAEKRPSIIITDSRPPFVRVGGVNRMELFQLPDEEFEFGDGDGNDALLPHDLSPER
jgi:hypothetical protein